MTFEFCDQRPLSCDTDSILTCGQGIDGITRTIRTDQHNILASLSSSSTHSQVGRLFAVRDGGTLGPAEIFSHLIIFRNPPDSGRIMYLNSVICGTSLLPPNTPLNHVSATKIDLIANPLFIIFEDLTPHNLNLGSSVTSAMMVGAHPQQNGGSPFYSTLQVTNTLQLNFGGEIIIPPDRNIAVRIQTFGLSPASPEVVQFEMTVTWYELELPTV